jgi:hypothetical protein
MQMLTPRSRTQIFDLFPRLSGNLGGYGQMARTQIKPKEAVLLT